MANPVSRFFHLISNIRNWHLYTFYKEKRHREPLHFITRPGPLSLQVDQDNYAVFKEIFVEDFYCIKDLLRGLGDRPLVIDVGANRGLFCALMLSKKPGAVIMAYEPLPDNVAALSKFKEINKERTQDLHCFAEAVSGTGEGQITLFRGGSELGSIASIYREFDKRNLTEITVPATSLSRIIQNLEGRKVDVLKIDCEGAEYPILYNSSHDVLTRADRIVIEAHELDGEKRNAASLAAYLRQHGFSVTMKKFRNDCYLMTAINTGSNGR